MDASTRQMLLEGSRITFPPSTLLANERITILDRARKNCMSHLDYFAGFSSLENEVYAWSLSLAKERRLSHRYRRDIGVEYAHPVSEKMLAIQLCPLFEKSHDMPYEAEFDEPLLYLGRGGRWLLWTTHYKAADPMPYKREQVQRGIRPEHTVHTALSSSIAPITTELIDSEYVAHRPELLESIVVALIRLGQNTIEQREHWLEELRGYVRKQKQLAQLIGVNTREL